MTGGNGGCRMRASLACTASRVQGSEFFYQIRGNMSLPTIQRGKRKVVDIKEGQARGPSTRSGGYPPPAYAVYRSHTNAFEARVSSRCAVS